MAGTTEGRALSVPAAGQPAEALTVHHAHEAYQLLHVVFTAVPLIAGADKFFHLLVNWDRYLSPAVVHAQVLRGHTHAFMYLVGILEIIVGMIVAFKPRIGAYLVTLWLWAVIVDLLLIPGYFDIALRDLGLSLGALALARLSHDFNK